jgi:hypothetical protein
MISCISDKAVSSVSWKDDFKKSFDFVYTFVRQKYPDIRFPCYGGRFYWFLLSRYFEELHFYLTKNSLLYTASSAHITEIPFDKIRKVSVKQGKFIKSSFHIRIVADKKYHFIIKRLDYLVTGLTGNSADNVKNFIDTFRSSIGDHK